ncbi:uncharacterized protein LOC116292027 [Actinia tenebrosa]|uniref:Uncharacterized protein LOC116292027 n=1 Tax=Actinia tenebrosa TaxID=6105 RepID=A0A6P8HJQ8_ACTTE|nr:uncharacterized protein LOC116292027 [Actinia tenebrosa]
MADPQFINMNTINGKTISPSLPKPYTGRVDFVGNLSQGHAWFVIKNLTSNDTDVYIARISYGDVSELQSYSVELSVKDGSDQVQKSEIVTVSSNHTNNTMKASSQTPRPSSSEATSITPHYLFTLFLVLTGQLVWLKRHLDENAPIFESSKNLSI